MQIEKLGIATVQITSIVDVAMMVGVSRLIRGYTITSPVGNFHLTPEEEKVMRRRCMNKAVDMLQHEGRKGAYETI
jgi:glycine reductase